MAALPAHAGVDGDAGGGNGRGAVSAPRHRGASSARAGHGPGHADAAAPDRSLRGVHAGGVRLHRARARDCDDGRHRAGGAGARAMHLPADAHHRRRCRAAREPARLGATSVGILPGPLRGRDAAGLRHRDRAGRRALQRAGARRHRPGRLRCRREDVSVGFRTAVRNRARQGLGGGRAGRVGRRRRHGRDAGPKGASHRSHGSGWHCECRTGGRAVVDSPGYPATDRGRSGGAHDGARRRPDGCAHWQGTCGDGAPDLNCTDA